MAGTIKGITIQIGADTTKLSAALNSANKSIKQTQTELRAVEKGLKLNPTNISLWKDKQVLLTSKIADTKTKLDALKQAQAKMDASGVDKASDEYQKLQREIDLTEGELQDLEQEHKNFGSAGAQAIAAVGKKLKELGGKLEAVGTTLTQKLTLPIAGFSTVAVKKFADVDKTMQLVNSTMGNGKKEAKLLGDAMKDAASNSTFGMSDAAKASLNFARAGLKAEEAADALAPAMNLAAAQGGDLDTVSQGLVATINGFGDSFDNAETYADVFANACSNSALDVDSLCNSMSVAAPIFKSAGYGVKDAALYMGLMANKGIDANVAANALKTGFARLISPSKQAQTWMDKLGISVTNADGSMKDATTIQKDLHKAFGKLTDSEKSAAASAIFGKNQMSNWMALIDSSPKEVDKLSKSLGKEKTASKQASDMMKGFGGSIEKLKSSVDVAVTSFGEALAPTILKVAKAIQGAVDKFNGLSNSQKQTIAKVALVVAALGPLLVIVGKVVGVIGTIMTFAPAIVTAAQTIAVLMTGTLIPAIGGVVAAVAPMIIAFAPFIAIAAAVVAAGILIYKNWDTIKKKAIELATMIKKKFEEIKTSIQQKLTLAKTIITTIWNNIKVFITNTLTTLKTTVSTALEAIKTFFNQKLTAASSLVSSKLSAIKQYFTQRLNEAKTAVGNALESIKSYFSSKLESAKTTVSNALNSIKNFFSSKLQEAGSTVSSKLGTIAGYFSSKLNDAKTAVSNKLEEIKNFFSSKLESAKSTASSKLNDIKSTFTSIIGAIPNAAANGLDDFGTKIAGKIKDAKSTIKSALDKIKEMFPFDIGKIIKFEVPKIKIKTETKNFMGKDITYPTGFDVDWHDKGGIFYSPSIIGVGEKRPEFVGALDDLRAIVREESGAGVSAQLMAQMVGLMQELVAQGGKQVVVNQTINAAQTSYAGQQREAAYQFKQIARTL